MAANLTSYELRISLAALSLAVVGAYSPPANAQNVAPLNGGCYIWIDAATGERVNTYPQLTEAGADPNHRTRPSVRDSDGRVVPGKDFVRGADGSWTDAATGQPVSTYPQLTEAGADPNHRTRPSVRDSDGRVVPGKDFARVPCPPSTASSTIGGGYLGGELAKNWGRVRSTETRDATGAITNQFIDSGDPLGIGIVGGYNFKPWNNNIVIGPFASFDYLNQTINHNFAGGQFLGTTTHWFINAGVKAGVVTAPGFYLYGLAGAAFLNHDLNVNFATAAQSNTTTPGFTAGFGGEYQPSSWQLAGHPVSVFAQYQHTWWNNANFNTPASSSAFNYAFRREDDTIKLGVNFYFGAAPASASPAYPVKAPMLK